MVLHLIGHLQKNKAGKAVKIYDYIQTVDSLELAKKIQKKANEINKTQKIYMQINIGNIKGRYGFKTKEIYEAAKTINELENILDKSNQEYEIINHKHSDHMIERTAVCAFFKRSSDS